MRADIDSHHSAGKLFFVDIFTERGDLKTVTVTLDALCFGNSLKNVPQNTGGIFFFNFHILTAEAQRVM